jgi:phage shock protein A
LRHLFIDVLTSDGRYGRKLDFADGVNVVRADNSMGKSTLMQSIVYGLGLEGMFGPSQDVPLAHAVTDYLEVQGGVANVVESKVYLEIENGNGESVTVERTIKGSRNRHLMTVADGRAITGTASGSRRDYFVRERFGAVSERGFHRKLAEFIGWDLPNVPRYDDVDCPLYLEAIFPLFYVEQKLGWGKLPARYPTYLGIRDLARRTVEFVLGLDAYKIAIEKLAVQDEIGRIRAQWSTLRSQTTKVAAPVSGIVNGLPTEPAATWPPQIPPRIEISQSGTWVPLRQRLNEMREALSKLTAAPVPSAGTIQPKATAELREHETQLAEREAAIAKLVEQLESDRSESGALEARIRAIEDDLRKHKDIGRLRKLGSDEDSEMGTGICPTCHQEIPETFLDTGRKAVPMSVEQNIQFLVEQLQLFHAVLTNARQSIEANEVEVHAHRTEIENLRQRIRSLRETIVSPGSTPSIDAIAERFRLEQRVSSLEYVSSRFEDSMAEFAQLADEWKEVEKRRARLPKGSLSDADEIKVSALQNSFRNQLQRYHMESLDPLTVGISRGNYEPEVSGLNLSADVSASDLIRMQWAYLLALLETGAALATNHPGLLIMDEPQQQSVQEQDFRAMIAYAIGLRNTQLIIATSDESPTLPEFLSASGVNQVHRIQARVITRM